MEKKKWREKETETLLAAVGCVGRAAENYGAKKRNGEIDSNMQAYVGSLTCVRTTKMPNICHGRMDMCSPHAITLILLYIDVYCFRFGRYLSGLFAPFLSFSMESIIVY